MKPCNSLNFQEMAFGIILLSNDEYTFFELLNYLSHANLIATVQNKMFDEYIHK